MKKLLLGSFLILFPFVSMAQEVTPKSDSANQWRYYVGLDAGLFLSDVKIHDDTFVDFGGVADIEFGARYNRTRVGFAVSDHSETSGIFQALVGHTASIENIALRLNGYYDYVSKEHFAMYIGAGMGINRYDYKIQNKLQNREESEHGASFIAGASTGMIFMSEHFDIDLGIFVDYISFPRIYSYGPKLGLRYKF